MRRVVASLLAFVLTQACVLSEHEDGIAIAVSLAHQHTGAWPDGVTLAHAYVAVTSIELERCPDEAIARAAELGWGGVAHAHTLGTPTRLGVPVVEDLLGPDDAPRVVGTLAAPPGRYCSVRITVGPADSDALGLPSEPSMLGMSALLDGQAKGAPLHSTCASDQVARVALAAPLEVSAENRAAGLLLTIDAARLLDGVDLTNQASVACAAAANAVGTVLPN